MEPLQRKNLKENGEGLVTIYYLTKNYIITILYSTLFFYTLTYADHREETCNI